MRKFKLHAAVLTLIALLGMAGPAKADSMTSLNISSYNLTQGVDVTLYGVHKGIEHGAEFFGRVNLSNGSYQDVIGYCVDLFDTVGTGTYTGYGLYGTTSSQSAQAAAWLMGNYDPALGRPYTSSLSTTITALQVAIWEVSFDYSATGSYNLTSGNFLASNLDTAVYNLAMTYLNALNGVDLTANGLNFSGVVRSGTTLAANGQTLTGGNQDLVVGNVASGGVPEPGSMILFGSAAGLMGWIRRRRTRKESEAA